MNPFLVMKDIENYFGLKKGSICMRDRHPRIALIRSLTMYVLREKYQLSLHEIGDYLERDHTTVVYGIKRFKTILNSKDNIYKQYKMFINNYVNIE